MHGIVGKVDRTAEHVQYTSVDVSSTKRTQLFIHPFWIGTTQLRNMLIPDIAQGLRKLWANPGYILKVLRY